SKEKSSPHQAFAPERRRNAPTMNLCCIFILLFKSKAYVLILVIKISLLRKLEPNWKVTSLS
ncbi:MAG: hypothetical protein LPK20_15470, partial [Halomonas sp.]|nr:hypothetical protein [Halomonas sp.]MDX5504217.1 hypothetical protein [Halomonas sp.]